MRLPALLLTLSLAGNAALLAAFALRPALAPAALRRYLPGSASAGAGDAHVIAAQNPAPGAATAAPKKSAAPARPAAADAWAALDTEDLRTLIARLRAAGFPPAVIRSIVSARINARFAPRFAELIRPASEQPFWKPDPWSGMANSQSFWEKQNQLYRDRMRAIREALGEESFALYGDDPAAAKRRQFGDIPESKVELVQRIVDDYAEMVSQVRAAMQGVTLPEDREKLALLEREKRADLAAILTPQELEEYEMRTSTVANRLRTPLSVMDATEEEFRTIFRIQQQFAAQLDTTGLTAITPEISRALTEARKQADAQVAAVLGPQRFADYQRANDREYQQLYGIAQREGIAADAVLRAYNLRDTYAQKSTAIMEDRAATPEQKLQALQTLGQNAKIELAGTLGEAAATTYAQSSRWVRQLTSGSGSFSIRDNAMVMRTLPPPKK
jgi:hypothetical protein